METLKFKSGSFAKLSYGLKKSGGRNHFGRITAYSRGGGHKNKIRIIDYKKLVWNVYGFIHRIEYDPNRNSLISLIVYSNGIMCYSIHIGNLGVGDLVYSTNLLSVDLKFGYSTFMKNIPVGVRINQLISSDNAGSQMVRSAGSFATIISKAKNIVIVKLPSNELRKFSEFNVATIGSISNFQFIYRVFGKAGYYRLKGWRPTVRGVAMNPIDHPHGGGQGKTSGGRPSVTPYGFITKGKPTVRIQSRYTVLKRKKK